ncbi:hypothetical protein F511_40194 [Dorcoceras hygrometricum]|uniref:Uncharacterized protein n=1 Tax=Dorcoceras hygrometricum TaxID=472368 RepID=A0A2Z7CFM2_9LAMI|nr:hypothetical protein F511_40194 [Dorcoceras hygrometricum]
MRCNTSGSRTLKTRAPETDLLTADCDDITADVIIADPSTDSAEVTAADHNFFQSAMLTSSLLITDSSNRNADVIIADSRFLFTSTS